MTKNRKIVFMRVILWVCAFVVAFLATGAKAVSNVTLDWNPSDDPDAVGYKIYYGSTSGDYTHSIDVGNVTSATITGLVDGATYYFAATTYDSSGNESDFSNEASYDAVDVAAATLTSMISGGSRFTFTVSGNSAYQYVIQASTNLIDWVTLQTNTAPFTFTDPDAAQFRQRFYRALSL